MPRMEGFWDDQHKPVPDTPMAKDHPFFERLLRAQAAARVVAYHGTSMCRICGKPNGSEEFRTRSWVWPSGYLHYIRDHHVAPSTDFLTYILLHY